MCFIFDSVLFSQGRINVNLNLIDLVKSFTSSSLQKAASIQPRTGLGQVKNRTISKAPMVHERYFAEI